jgi:holin-like protein
VISRYGLRLLVVVVVSTWVGMATTAVVLRALLRREAARGPRDE